MSNPKPVEALLDEVDRLVAHVKRAYKLNKLDIEVIAEALNYCLRVRADPTDINTAPALTSIIEKLRDRASVARMYAPAENSDDRAHRNAKIRREAFWREHDRGFSQPEAYKRAAAKLGVHPKTIKRALEGH